MMTLKATACFLLLLIFATTAANWDEIPINTVAAPVTNIIIDDLDLDSDLDVAAVYGSSSSWFRNGRDNNVIWPNTVIQTNIPGASLIARSAISGRTLITAGTTNKQIFWGQIGSNGNPSMIYYVFNNPNDNSVSNARAVDVGDIDVDGKYDVVVGWGNDVVKVYTLETIPNSWSNGITVDVGSTVHDLRMANFVGASSTTKEVIVATQNGIKFIKRNALVILIIVVYSWDASTLWSFSTPGPSTVEIANFNNDGWTDAVVTSQGDRAVSILINNSGNSWSRYNVVTFPAGELVQDATFIDIDKNGCQDVAVCTSAGIKLYMNSPQCNAVAWTSYGTISTKPCYRLKSGDIDRNTFIDLISSNSGDISWWRNPVGDTPTPVPTPTPTPLPTLPPGATLPPTATPSRSPTPSSSPSPSPSHSPSATPYPTATSFPTASPTGTPVPTPTVIVLRSDSPTPTRTEPTRIPPTPTDLVLDGELELSGDYLFNSVLLNGDLGNIVVNGCITLEGKLTIVLPEPPDEDILLNPITSSTGCVEGEFSNVEIQATNNPDNCTLEATTSVVGGSVSVLITPRCEKPAFPWWAIVIVVGLSTATIVGIVAGVQAARKMARKKRAVNVIKQVEGEMSSLT